MPIDEDEDLDILQSIKGWPEYGGAFVGGDGSIENFSSHKKLIAFAGLDPSVTESGQYIGQAGFRNEAIGICGGHLSDDHSVVSWNAWFKAYFQKRKQKVWHLRKRCLPRPTN